MVVIYCACQLMGNYNSEQTADRSLPKKVLSITVI